MHKRNKRAQMTVEYIILFTAVIMVAIILLLKKNSPFQDSYLNALKERALTMEASTYILDSTNTTEPSIGNP